MNTIARDPARPIVMIAALGYILMLAAALIWLNLSPLIILILTVGGGVLAVCALRPLIGVHALIALMQINVALAESGAGGMALKALGAIIVLGWLLNMATRRKQIIRFDDLLLAIAAFLVWCALLFFFAIDAAAAAGRTLTFCQLAIAAVMFSSVVNTPERLRGVYLSIVAWTTLSAILGMIQYATGISDVAVGLVGNRNMFAMYLDVAIVCAYLLHQSARNPLQRMLLAASIPLLFIALALTFSRAGLIVLAAVMALLFIRAARERRFRVLIATSALLFLMALILPSAFWNRASTIAPSIQAQEGTFGLRVRLWKVGIRMIADRPLVGVGPGNFTVAFPRYARGVMVKKTLNAHNTYVSVASEMGLPGLSLFLLIHVLALKRIGRASVEAGRAGDRNLRSLTLTTEAVILVTMLIGLSGHLEYSKYLWMFFGLAMAIRRMPSAAHEHSPQTLSERGDGSFSRENSAAIMPQPRREPGE